MNITKLKSWDTLKNLGFIPIKYYSNGKLVNVGASLQKQIKDIDGKMHFIDIITIQPYNLKHTNKKYHISGKVKTAFYDKCYRYELNQKIEITKLTDSINDYFTANEILDTINLMTK
jgi:hypothetical protein